MAVAAEAALLDCEMSIKTVRLEKEYEKSLADSLRLLDAEKDRVRRMEQLLLQFENETLRSRLDRAHEQLLVSTQAESEARLQLDEAYQEIDRLDLRVQSSSNEVERLKGELSTLNDTSTGYSTLLTEKLHLSRDISHLESEIKRLKSQNTLNQGLITEKHEMERQLKSLEVHLQDEKNAHERTRAKSSQQAAEIDRLSARIDDLQSELSKELRQKQQQNAGSESQRSVLEKKVETLKKQLRSVKDKLHGTQQELQQRRIDGTNDESAGTEPRSRVVPLQRSGPTTEYHSGVTIATPGAVRVKEKSQKQSALPGDKSAFSITPFLSRTGGPKDSPSSSEAEEDPMDVTLDESNASFRKTQAISELNGIDAALNDRPGPTQVVSPKAGAGKPKIKARDRKPVATRPTIESKKPGTEHADMSDDAIEPFIGQGQAKPKKRKLGAQRDRNLFEEEEEEEEDMLESRKPGRKVGLGAGRTSVLATAISSTAAGDRGARALGFGGFSPLKRDRKRL